MIQDRNTKKQELIKNGTFERFRAMKKEQYDKGIEPTEDPSYYFVDEEAKELLDSLEKSTKRKKATFRKRASFMSQYYENIGLLTLTYSEKSIDFSSFKSKRDTLIRILKTCFGDFEGKFEISPKGRLHFHAIVGWNGEIETFETTKEGTLIKKPDLQELWYGETTEEGQPSKYGIYQLKPIRRKKDDINASTNYTMKSLNTIEAYITKDEGIDLKDLVDESLVLAVNSSNIIVARGTPYQQWNKAREEQDKMIRRTARTFNGSFYDKNKFNGRKVFREWAEREKEQNISIKRGEHIDLLGKDFKLVSIDDYKENKQ